MVQLFTDIGPMLLHYRKANTQNRHAMVLDKIRDIKNLSGKVLHTNHITAHYKTLAYAATFFNYADALYRIENQQFFEILFDFYQMELDEELNSWFEFGKIPGQMRLKHPLDDYTPEIWEKFRIAQKEHLKRTNKSHLFNLNQLDIYHPPANQLYPVQIQMGGTLQNEAVDRINVDSQGRILFATHFGFYLLPGGGMIEKNSVNNMMGWQRKMLEEHLEEEHANLYLKAAPLFDQLTRDDFNAALTKAFTNKQAQSLTAELLNRLKEHVTMEGINSIRLQKIITELDDRIEILNKRINAPASTGKVEQVIMHHWRKSLIELRARVQVQVFELTPLFTEALDYIKKKSICVDIQQYLDTRVLGGSQISHCFIMSGQPLEEWFAEHFKGIDGEFGDDISGSEIARMNLLQAIGLFRKIKFSHLLIALAAYEKCLDNGTLSLANAWNEAQFGHACEVLLQEGNKVVNRS